MTITTENTSRTAHLLELMKKGDDAFNARDFAAMDAIHHPDLIAHVTGNVRPIYGRSAHAEAIKGMFATFPDVHVQNNLYPIQFGNGDWITVISPATGTPTEEMALADGTAVPSTGKSFGVEFVQTVKFDGEVLVEIAAFWDPAQQAE